MQKERISLYMRPKTNWLSRKPFKLENRVQVPAGVPLKQEGRFDSSTGVRLQEIATL